MTLGHIHSFITEIYIAPLHGYYSKARFADPALDLVIEGQMT